MKPVSPFAKPATLDETMSAGWRALETEDVSGWVCRFSHGVTRRANSVLPLAGPADVAAAIVEAENRYARRGLPAVFQISPDSRPGTLDATLAARGYVLDSPTLVQFLPLDESGHQPPPGDDARIELSCLPGGAWLEAFWEVEGPHDAPQRDTSRAILANTDSIYASLVVDGAVEAVARLALVGNLGGIYSVATREPFRSRGHGRAVVQALLGEASRLKLAGVWLQVVASNLAARALYESLGFGNVSRYHYRVEPAARP